MGTTEIQTRTEVKSKFKIKSRSEPNQDLIQIKMKLLLVVVAFVGTFAVCKALPAQGEMIATPETNIDRDLYEMRKRAKKLTPIGGQCWKDSECVDDGEGWQHCECYAFYDGGRCVSCNSYIGRNNCAVLQIKPWCVGKREDITRVLREENELMEMVQQERLKRGWQPLKTRSDLLTPCDSPKQNFSSKYASF